MTYSLSAKPLAGMKFDAKTGSLSGAPASATVHTCVMTVKGKTRQSTSTLHVDIQPTSAPAGTVTPTSQTLEGQTVGTPPQGRGSPTALWGM